MNVLPLRLILDDLRSAGNVGSILRTADAMDVELVYACGYTPYPHVTGDSRPPHTASSNQRAIAKTALGAESTVPVSHYPDAMSAIRKARSEGFKIIVMEQSESALKLHRYQAAAGAKLALVVGNEVDGVPAETVAAADTILELPMLGRKESLNVAVAAALALYQLRFFGAA